MSEAIIEAIRNVITVDWLAVIMVAIMPVVELRGAIPIAVAMGFDPWISLLLAFVGSSLVVPILLLLLKPVLNLLKKIKWFSLFARAVEDLFNGKADEILEKVEKKGAVKDTKLADKIKFFGVMIFVAVPIPLTGVWTGAAVAVFLNLKFHKALISVVAGNLIAGLIVTAASLLFAEYLNIVIGVFAFIVIIMFCVFFYKIIKRMIKLSKEDKMAKIDSSDALNDKIDDENK